MKEVKLQIPTEWQDITIGTYQKYVKIQEGKLSDKNKTVGVLSLLCNVDKSIIRKMDYKDMIDILGVIKKLLDTEPNKKKFRKVFKFKDDDYGFIPNLSKLTTGEYIDLEEYCKEPIKNLHIIMSILYRKITRKSGDKYAIENYDPDEFKEDLFKGCPMDIALCCLGFFLTLGDGLAVSSRNYLKAQDKKRQKA
jgi:hypothetical protein